MSVGLCGQPVAEHRGRDGGHRFSEAFSARAAAHGLSPEDARISEVKVFDRDGVDLMAAGVVDQPCDCVADLSVATRGRSRQVNVDACRGADRVTVFVETAQRQMPGVEVHADDGIGGKRVDIGFTEH